MTSDDTDTPRGNDEDTEESVSVNEETTAPRRDPETGQFLPKNERPDDESNSTDVEATEGAQPDESTDSAEEAEARSQPTADTRATESESMVEEEEPEPESMEEAHGQESESMDERRVADAEPPSEDPEAEPPSEGPETEPPSEDPEAEPTSEDPEAEESDAEPPRATPKANIEGSSTQATGLAGGPSARPAGRPTPGTVFVPNPNGYPRPPATYLPMHPWLRLPSRPPAHETISR